MRKLIRFALEVVSCMALIAALQSVELRGGQSGIELARRPTNPTGVIATFETSVGTIEAELFDDKPATTANFIKYGYVKGWTNGIFHRWLNNFIVQGGGFYIENGSLQSVAARPPIVNEYNVGTKVSNIYGTIAMAKSPTSPDSATSQWFFNLTNNASNLDNQNGGFTVFGRVISGTNILNKFIPPPPSQGIHLVDLTPGTPNTPYEDLPVLDASSPIGANDLLYVKISFRRHMNVQLTKGAPGEKVLTFNSVPTRTNVVQVSSSSAPAWQNLTSWVATATTSTATLRNRTNAWERYRVRIDY